MDAALPIFLLSALMSGSLIPLARRLAPAVGLIDRPDGRRKIHVQPIPVTGGIAVFTAIWLVLGMAMIIPNPAAEYLWSEVHLLIGLFCGSCVIVTLGIADDLGMLRGRHKLLGQVLAAAIVMVQGVYVQHVQLFGFGIDLGFLAIPFTCLFLLGAINSLNLLDGMDGLLASLGTWLSLALAGMAFLAGFHWAAIVALVVAGALVGFLRFNFPPASIFMGDAGSMLVGLILGTLVIQCSLKAPATLVMALPLGLMTLPFFDTAAAIVRRKLTGRSIYTTDRGHLHHCLQRQGMSVRWVLLLLSMFCLITSAGVLASKAFGMEWIALLTGASIVAFLISFRLFGYAETMLLKERLVSWFQPPQRIRQMEVRLQGSANWKQLWQLITAEAQNLKVSRLLLDVNAPFLHESYHARWDSMDDDAAEMASFWRVEIPLSAQGRYIGRLVVAGPPDVNPVWEKVAVLSKVVADNMNDPDCGVIGVNFDRPWLLAGEHPVGLAEPLTACTAAPLANGPLAVQAVSIR